MSSINNAAGNASDALLKLTTGMSRPSSYTAREIRREHARRDKKATPRLDRRPAAAGFGQ
jgi:hypothetical protein